MKFQYNGPASNITIFVFKESDLFQNITDVKVRNGSLPLMHTILHLDSGSADSLM
ncbi:MAG: hypothetical protein ABIS12_01000 [Bacteroidia bacterium]